MNGLSRVLGTASEPAMAVPASVGDIVFEISGKKGDPSVAMAKIFGDWTAEIVPRVLPSLIWAGVVLAVHHESCIRVKFFNGLMSAPLAQRAGTSTQTAISTDRLAVVHVRLGSVTYLGGMELVAGKVAFTPSGHPRSWIYVAILSVSCVSALTALTALRRLLTGGKRTLKPGCRPANASNVEFRERGGRELNTTMSNSTLISQIPLRNSQTTERTTSPRKWSTCRASWRRPCKPTPA